MDKKLRGKINYIVIFVCVYIMPILFFYWYSNSINERFYERVDQDYQICSERAERDSVETRWCSEIRSASEDTFRATRIDNFYPLLLLFQPILFVTMLAVSNLNKQVKELKEKTDV